MVKTDKTTTVDQLRAEMKQFVDERDWNQFHNPKNISMSIAIEAAELMEKFQFLSNEQSIKFAQENKQEVAHELVDVLCYVLSFANACDIDLSSMMNEKMQLNIKKYPVDLAKGRHDKYTKLK